MRYTAPVIVAAVIVLSGCRQKKDGDHIPLNKMKEITWDLIKADGWYLQVIAKDSAARRRREDMRLYAQVFALHGVTRDQYFETYRYYEAHPPQFKILVDSIGAYSYREKNSLSEDHGQAKFPKP